MDSYVNLGKTGGFVILATFLLSFQSLIITYSKTSGKYTYNTTSTILLAEILKFCISAFMLYYFKMEINFRIRAETLPYSVPALIYFIQNNLVFIALSYVDPTTYQVLVNLKIFTTGVLFRIFMGKELSSMQWAALVLLMIGCATSQLSTKTEQIFAIPIQGILICVVLSILSAAAGIATEYIMKKTPLKADPLHTQNMHLYFYGIIFNAMGYVLEGNPASGMFDGYNFTAILVIMSYSVTGLIISVIMRYADNMVKIYSVAVSMILTMLISIFLFSYVPTTQLLFGIIIITISILMYFNIINSNVSQTPPTAPSVSTSAPSSSPQSEEKNSGNDEKGSDEEDSKV